MKLSHSKIWTAGVLLLFPLGLVIAGTEPPAAEMSRKPSTYAPAKDPEAQVTFFLDRIREDLADEAKYAETGVERVKRDANTLAVLAGVPEGSRSEFYSRLQANFSSIYTSEKVTHVEVLKNIEPLVTYL